LRVFIDELWRYEMGASRTGSFIYFQPLFGTLSAIVMVNQTLNATILAAAGLIILGVIVTLRK
jgi:drug/metabolite transporter (DMT)-like permease